MSVDRRAFLAGSSRLLSASLLAAGIPAAAEAENQPQTAKRKYRLIATEEAFSIPEQADEFRKIAPIAYSNPDLDMWRSFVNAPPGASPLLRRLLDLEGERIQIMDQAGVDMHLLSLTSPGVQMFDTDTATSIATTANDRLAEMVNKHPKRFAGLASFAPQDPKRAAKEIDRAMNQLKLNGLIVNSHTDGEYLDDRKYWPIFEAATACNAALYIHPRNMPDPCAFMLHATPNLGGGVEHERAWVGHVARVNVDRGIPSGRRFEDRPVFPVVQVFAVGVRVDNQPVELKLIHRAVDFLGRPPRDPGGRSSQGPRTAWMLLHHLRPVVVCQGRHAGCRIGIEHLHARRSERKEVHIHAGLIHNLNPLAFKIKQAPQQGRRAGRGIQETPPHIQVRIGIGDGRNLAKLVRLLRNGKRFFGRDQPIFSFGRLWLIFSLGGCQDARGKQTRRQASRRTAETPFGRRSWCFPLHFS